MIVVWLYYFLYGGDVIDFFGVCEFGFWYLELEQIIQGFVEFYDYLGLCKYCDCKYDIDLGCVIWEVVEEGKIVEICFENYYCILESMVQVKMCKNFFDMDD